MRSPHVHDLAWLKTISPCAAVVRASASVRARVLDELPFRAVQSFDEIPASAGTLIVAGGGALMDEAKYFRARQRPDLRLVLMPSLWGSGAEASPITVRNRDGAKVIAAGEEFLPDAVVYWPELLATVSAERARWACGDTWAHALEAFLSPLAGDGVRDELASLIAEMLRVPLTNDPRWFPLSARACALQAQASVGLVHGIAHVLEPRQEWGHARLCAAFLLPVMDLNRRTSAKWTDLTQRYALDEAAIWNVLREISAPADCAALLPLLKEHWTQILRDPCTRTNGALIRLRHIAEFELHKAAA